MFRHVRAIVSGIVQGVGYRYFFRERASVIGVSGWVRNLSDGRVLFEITGTPEQVKQTLALASQGPRSAQVKDVTIEFEKEVDTRPFQDLEIRT